MYTEKKVPTQNLNNLESWRYAVFSNVRETIDNGTRPRMEPLAVYMRITVEGVLGGVSKAASFVPVSLLR